MSKVIKPKEPIIKPKDVKTTTGIGGNITVIKY